MRLCVQLDKGTDLKFLDAGQSGNERAVVRIFPSFNDERVGNLVRPADFVLVAVLEKCNSGSYFGDIFVVHHAKFIRHPVNRLLDVPSE